MTQAIVFDQATSFEFGDPGNCDTEITDIDTTVDIQSTKTFLIGARTKSASKVLESTKYQQCLYLFVPYIEWTKEQTAGATEEKYSMFFNQKVELDTPGYFSSITAVKFLTNDKRPDDFILVLDITKISGA